MKGCDHARRMFGPLWDDETTRGERDWLERHFASCGACREDYDRFARTLETVASLPRHEAAPDLAARALATARGREPAPDRIEFVPVIPRWTPVAAAAAVALIALAVLAPRFPGPSSSDGRMARVEATVPEPRLVATATARPPEAVATAVDSLFDHGEDVEFILDPVTLSRGRAHRGADRGVEVRGEQAVISF